MAQVVKFERDMQTISLIGSFLDMAVASSRKILTEATAWGDLPREAKDDGSKG